VLFRIALALFLCTLAVFAVSDRLGYDVRIPLDEAIQRDLEERATPEELNRRTVEALDRGDISEALSFYDLAQSLGRPLPEATMQRLRDEQGTARTAVRNTEQFITGFATGSGEGTAGLAGSVISDFTVIGDLRDLSREGGRMMAGEEYSRLLLGLSAVGIAATAATLATGGGGAPVRVGMSVLKAAFRGGMVTAEFGASLGRMLARSVNFTRIGEIARGVDLASPTAVRRAATEVAENVRPQVFARVADNIADVQKTVGVADTVRLMRYVRSTGDLADMPAFVTKFGARSRAVASFMGRASLRAFRATIRIGKFLLESLLAVLLWFGGLVFTMLLGLGERGTVALARKLPPHRRSRAPPPTT
jgi:hypothetical protein